MVEFSHSIPSVPGAHTFVWCVDDWRRPSEHIRIWAHTDTKRASDALRGSSLLQNVYSRSLCFGGRFWLTK